MEHSTDIKALLQKQVTGEKTLADKRRLFKLLNNARERELFAVLFQEKIDQTMNIEVDDGRFEGMISYILNYETGTQDEEKDAGKSEPNVRRAHRVHFLKRSWLRYAAAIIIVLGVGVYLWNTQHDKPLITQTKPVPVKNDVAPGSNKAVLTLSDGRKMELDDRIDSITEFGTIIKNQDGQLVYGRADKVVFNTMSTPRGGQYQLTLPDGTKVWLNAASSIQYPTAFTGSTREVSCSGEAYFEVKKNPAQPFIVKTPKDVITVLGTSFNVNAYEDEPAMQTSLLEGSVKVNQSILYPNQAYLEGKIISCNPSQVIAWKNGIFDFNEKNLREVLRQVARWYDVEIVYEKEPGDGQFIGEMSRSLTLNEIISFLNGSQVNARLEGRTIIISK